VTSLVSSLLHDPELEALLSRLHAQSEAQTGEVNDYFARRAREGTLKPGQPLDADLEKFLADKMFALDPDKAELCYLLCRSLRAARVVEAGTSFGVSTLYLAAAVRDTQLADRDATRGVVIATEYEPAKVEVARANFVEAGLADYIELREGDLRRTLRDVGGPVDFMLVDIWEVALPALELVAPKLRTGAIVATDNTKAFADSYRDYFEFIHDPKNRFRTLTLPFEGGLELSVRV
jgi:predicted O-methyltransferase YrrM